MLVYKLRFSGRNINAFRWKLFFRRMLGGLVICTMWVIEDTLKHDFTGVATAIVTAVVASIVCYFWTRSDWGKRPSPSSRREVGPVPTFPVYQDLRPWSPGRWLTAVK